MSDDIIHLDGELVAAANARISALDRGFLFAESVWETVRLYAGAPFLLGPHFRRLNRAAEQVGIALPWSLEGLRAVVDETAHANGGGELALRIIVTAGSVVAIGRPSPTVVIMPRPLGRIGKRAEESFRVTLVPHRASLQRAKDPSIKSGNYLPNVLAAGVAASRGAHEAVMLDAEGRVTECAQSNIFAVVDDRVETPDERLGLLPGITRELIIGLAGELGRVVHRVEIDGERLRRAEEVFVTGSVKEVVAVTAIDERAVGAGAAGPVTQALAARYREVVTRFIEHGDEPVVTGPWDRIEVGVD